MDQQKIGSFLKELRKEKHMTQERLAEVLGVSGRTVSRWETGRSLPDLDLLMLLADYHGVEPRELLDGERKEKTMDKELEEKHQLTRRMCALFIAGAALFTLYLVWVAAGRPAAWEKFASCALGFAYGMMLVGVLYTSGHLARFRALKLRLLKGLRGGK